MPKMRTDDGVEIHYRIDDFRDPWITDPGVTILLTHGFVRSMKWFAQWVPALSRKYRVVRYDVRGCGESSAPPEGDSWSADRLARDALNLIDHLGLQKVHWVGFESGGMWGLVFAINHPDRLLSLTVLNTPATGIARSLSAWGKGGGPGSEEIKKIGLKQWLLDSNRVRMDASMADPKMMEWHMAEQSKTPTHVAAGIMGILETLDISSKYSSIKVPTLIMVSENALNCPLEEEVAVRRQIPNARMVVFPHIGAGAQILIPDRCTEEVLSFLA